MFKGFFGSRPNVDPSPVSANRQANLQAEQGTWLLQKLRSGPKQAWTKKNPQFAQARRPQNPQYAQAIRGKPQQQQSQYASLHQLNKQNPYADVEINPETGLMRIVDPSRRDSGYLSMGQPQEKVQPTLTYSGTQQQQRVRQAQNARRMKQASTLYSKVNKRPVIVLDQPPESSTDPYQPFIPFDAPVTGPQLAEMRKSKSNQLINRALQQRQLARKNEQPIYQKMSSVVHVSQQNKPFVLKQRKPSDKLPQLPAQPYARAVRQAQSKLSKKQLQNIARRAEMFQQELQSPYSTLAETLADTGYNRRFAKEVLRFYSLMKFYDTFEQSLKTFVNSVSMSDTDKREIINNIEKTIGELKERIKTAKQQGKYSQENKVGVKYFDTPRNLIEFINEAESREKKLLTELIVAIQKSCKKQQKKQQSPLTPRQKKQQSPLTPQQIRLKRAQAARKFREAMNQK